MFRVAFELGLVRDHARFVFPRQEKFTMPGVALAFEFRLFHDRSILRPNRFFVNRRSECQLHDYPEPFPGRMRYVPRADSGSVFGLSYQAKCK